MSAESDEEFRDFMRGRWAATVRLAYGLTGDAWQAEDVAQDAFARAYASWGRVSRAGDPEAYVRRVMLSTFLTWTLWSTAPKGGSSGTFTFVLNHNETSGTVHELGMFQWLEQNGWIPNNSAVWDNEFGFEMCSTG